MPIIMFIISVIAGCILYVLFGIVFVAIYRTIRGTIRLMLYTVLRIDSFTKDEKIMLGLIKKEETPAPKINPETDIISNCMLSKSEFPNIEKYFKGYSEQQVTKEQDDEIPQISAPKSNPKIHLLTGEILPEGKDSMFSGMTHSQMRATIQELKEKSTHTKLSHTELTVLEVLSDPDNLRRTRSSELLRKQLNKRYC